MIHALLEQPLLLFLLSLVLSSFALRKAVQRAASLPRRIGTACGCVSILVFLALNLLNLTRHGFLWHDEASVLSVAAAYAHGQPMYHARTDPALYALLYGPATFISYVPLLKASSNPVMAARWLGLAVNLANMLLLYTLLRWKTSSSTALGLLPLALGTLLSSPSHLFGVRGDAMLLLCFCVGLACVLCCESPAVAVAAGIASGIALDFKLTVAPAAALLLLLIYRWRGRKMAFVCGATMAATTASLFLLPHISIANYLQWLALSSRQGMQVDLFRDSIFAALLLLTPALLFRYFRTGPQRRSGAVAPSQKGVALLFLVAMVLSILAGSKNGAGTWHLWPMLPFILLWTGDEMWRRSEWAGTTIDPTTSVILAAVALASTVVVLRLGLRDLRTVHSQDSGALWAAQRGAEDELHGLVRRNPGQNLAMGYGRNANDFRSSLRFELPLAGEDYFLDENALVELTKSGAALPAGVAERVLSCADLWLIPHGDQPFETRRTGVLPSGDSSYLFPDRIRSHFSQTHLRRSVGTYFDLWGCPAGTAAARGYNGSNPGS